MRMNSDLGKLKRRNYMVKAQLKSLESKSRAINEKINSDSNVDEWAESYIARADAQIDDVSDYMEFRNLQNLSGFTDKFDPVTWQNTSGMAATIGLIGGVVGLLTYNRSMLPEELFGARMQHAAKYALIAAGITTVSKGIIFGGQQTGQY